MDTPGIMREHRHKLDKRMMKSVRKARGDAEVMLAMFDAGRHGNMSPIQMYESIGINPGTLPYAIILNKCDTVKDDSHLLILKKWFQDNTPAKIIFTISAKTGEGVQEVCDWAAEQLPLGPTLYPKETLSEHPERFFVTEILREKIFEGYSQEIPYCCQVNVIDYIERNKTRQDGTRMKDYVAVEIIVEKTSQKGIIIGSKGSMIKKVAEKARRDIEAFLGRGVYLDIQVKVKNNWRNHESLLGEYGYSAR